MKVLLSFVLILGFAIAQLESTNPAPDLSPRVFEIAKTLRCPVCQGESAGESNSGIAKEMRNIIAEQLAAGKSQEEITQYFVNRYGNWIVYSPPKRGLTLLVWLSPVIGLGLLGFGLWRYTTRVRAVAGATDEELAALEAKLKLDHSTEVLP